jgi:hypothetical protein
MRVIGNKVVPAGCALTNAAPGFTHGRAADDSPRMRELSANPGRRTFEGDHSHPANREDMPGGTMSLG